MARMPALSMPDPDAAWHPELIKAQLRIRHPSLAALARQWGVSKQLISVVLRHPSASIRIERRIAAELGTTPQAIWPDRWDAAGEPLLPRAGLAKTGTPALPRHRQNREAA